MSFCPFCGEGLGVEMNQCKKCGAVISTESKDKELQCPKCGGLLRGSEENCPWCGFSCFKGSEVSDAYQLLRSLENALREFIEARLSAVFGSNWWQKCVPGEVHERARERKSNDERLYPWYIQKDLPPIYYVTFTDYAKIIASPENWSRVFFEAFKDKSFIMTKLRELEPIRNAIAHSQHIEPKSLQKLKLYCEEITACLSSSSKRRER